MKKYILIFLSISIFSIYNIKAQVNGAILQGNGVTASGQYSSAIGNSNMSLGASSFSMGFTTQAKGITSFAGGWESVAEGDASFAFGYSCTAKQAYNIVFGSASQAYMPYGIAIGNNAISGTTNKGMNAICIGNQAHAEADYSMAFGQYVKSSGNNSIAIGKGFSNTQFLVNNTANSIALGMGSTVPTLFIKTATGSATATGTVGIGTTLIGSKLQVNGNVAIGYSNSTAAPANGLLINGNLGIGTTAATTTEKLTVNGKVKTNALVLPDGEINSFAALNLWNRNGNDIFRLNGKVGIGTNNPMALLSLGNSLANTKLALYDNGSSMYGMGIQSNQFLFHLGNREARYSFYDQAGQNEIVTIKGNGNVGIGSQDPNQALAIMKELSATMRITSTDIDKDDIFYYTWDIQNLKGQLKLNFATGTNNPNPTTKTFVNFDPIFNQMLINGELFTEGIVANGKILAEEIEVVSNVEMPDYVFGKDYQLKSLKEVEEYINTYKHLPEVPSAKQFKEEGINMAKMDALLLKKIEELTLYIIEQQKDIQQLKEELSEIKLK